MEFRVLYGFAIFLFIISLIKNVRAAAIDIPLISNLNAPLKAELDISSLTTQLKELIRNEVKQAVSVAMKDLAESIVDKRVESALENLQTYNNLTISTFLHEMEDVTARKKDLSAMEEKLEKEIEQMKEQQKLTGSKLSGVESEVNRSTERVAMTAFVSSSTRLSAGSVIKFSDVKFSEGINDLPTFKSTGKFKCGKSGLYIVSVTIEFSVNNSEFHMYVNGNVFTKNYKHQKRAVGGIPPQQ
ncbi:unnamed protein product [Mytilus coruscus]|uniref:C1q domain-containing protein n=1 Tax=Mytilus coruscus TaxID=42192 RepID=A0A6J8ENC1_MYTCO|nr:unnamed protein product [Mytilus coruscus]